MVDKVEVNGQLEDIQDTEAREQLDSLQDQVSMLDSSAVKTVNGVNPEKGNVDIPAASSTQLGLVKQADLGGTPTLGILNTYLYGKIVSTSTVRSMAYGLDRFEVVNARRIFTGRSRDSWALYKELDSSSSEFTKILFAKDKFIALAGRQVWEYTISTDWVEKGPTSGQAFRNIIYNYDSGTYILEAYSNYVWTSTDGISWVEKGQFDFSANDVIYGDGLYVGIYDAEHTSLRISEDTETWVTLSLATEEGETIKKVCFTGREFIAVGSKGSIFVSQTGRENWTRRPSPVTSALYDIASSDLGIFVVGDKCILFSQDAINWSLFKETDFIGYSIAIGGGLVAIGGTGRIYCGNIIPPQPNGVAIDAEGNMTVPYIDILMKRIEALEK